ncbi:hypothetical protein ABW19_dt0207000 [Dactylella cylindrospora]|nr:hypothetical protein ABW19_dt0207000 [Dactylella cylindrospora]
MSSNSSRKLDSRAVEDFSGAINREVIHGLVDVPAPLRVIRTPTLSRSSEYSGPRDITPANYATPSTHTLSSFSSNSLTLRSHTARPMSALESYCQYAVTTGSIASEEPIRYPSRIQQSPSTTGCYRGGFEQSVISYANRASRGATPIGSQHEEAPSWNLYHALTSKSSLRRSESCYDDDIEMVNDRHSINNGVGVASGLQGKTLSRADTGKFSTTTNWPASGSEGQGNSPTRTDESGPSMASIRRELVMGMGDAMSSQSSFGELMYPQSSENDLFFQASLEDAYIEDMPSEDPEPSHIGHIKYDGGNEASQGAYSYSLADTGGVTSGADDIDAIGDEDRIFSWSTAVSSMDKTLDTAQTLVPKTEPLGRTLGAHLQLDDSSSAIPSPCTGQNKSDGLGQRSEARNDSSLRRLPSLHLTPRRRLSSHEGVVSGYSSSPDLEEEVCRLRRDLDEAVSYSQGRRQFSSSQVAKLVYSVQRPFRFKRLSNGRPNVI